MKARARELSKLIAIQSELGATRLQDVPDGSSQAQREQRGRVCVRHSTAGAGRSVMTGRQHQPANCIIWGWLGVEGQGRWDQAEGPLPMPCSWLIRCHRAAVVRGLKGWPWSPPQGQAAGESLATEQCEVKASRWLTGSHQSTQ